MAPMLVTIVVVAVIVVIVAATMTLVVVIAILITIGSTMPIARIALIVTIIVVAVPIVAMIVVATPATVALVFIVVPNNRGLDYYNGRLRGNRRFDDHHRHIDCILIPMDRLVPGGCSRIAVASGIAKPCGRAKQGVNVAVE